MFKNILLFTAISLLVSLNALAECYVLSADGRTWSRTPELMCVEAGVENSYTITFKNIQVGREKIFGQFFMSLLNDTANTKTYGSPISNSLFQAFTISIDSGEQTIQMGS